MIHRTVFFQFAHHVGNRRVLLADCHIDTLNASAFLVDDGVNRYRGLASLAVADDQFALAAANWHHRVNRFEAGLHRLAHGLPLNHARRNLFNRRRQIGLDRTFAINRVTQGIDHTPQQRLANRHFQDAPGAERLVAFGQMLKVTQDHRTD